MWLLIAAIIACAALVTGCDDSDVGQCCVCGKAGCSVPDPEIDPATNEPRDIIRVDPAYNCEFLACVSYQGSTAYCTKECVSDDSCPEGFECKQALESDPGPDSQIKPTDKFCVHKVALTPMYMCVK